MPTLTLQRLNMDTTWHCTLGDLRVLVDPWLVGTEVDYFGWFNTQWHRTPPMPCADIPAFDTVLITQKYPDHCHPRTLETLQPSRVIAPDTLTRRIAAILPQAEVIGVGADLDGLHHRGVQLHRLASPRRFDPIYDAFLLDDGHHSVLIAPHGLQLTDQHVQVVQAASPLKVLLSALDLYELPGWLGGTIKPGLSGLRDLVDRLRPEVVVQTHDEDKHARGLVSRLARITPFHPDQLAAHAWLAQRYHAVSDYEPMSL